MSERISDAIEVGLNLTRLGECTCEDPLIVGDQKVWPSAYGTYNRNNLGCENFQPYKEDEPQSCGNCKFWEALEGMDAYE